jgi:hypothetical protein
MDTFANGYQTLTSKMKTSRDYLARAANPPKFQSVTKAYMSGAKFHPRKVLTLAYLRASSRVSPSSSSSLTPPSLSRRKAGISTRQLLR